MTEQLEHIVDSTTAKTIARLAQVLVIPVLLWLGTTLMSMDSRLGKVEQIITDKIVDQYPRGEATQAFSAVSARVDANTSMIHDNTRRIENLEIARNRLH